MEIKLIWNEMRGNEGNTNYDIKYRMGDELE